MNYSLYSSCGNINYINIVRDGPWTMNFFISECQINTCDVNAFINLIFKSTLVFLGPLLCS